MKKQLLEAGQILSTHGVQGELKVAPWCDTPEFLLDFSTLYVDEVPLPVSAARVHKGHLLVSFAGVTSINEAICLKGKVVCINRADAALPPGRHFLADLIGLEVRAADDGHVLGTLVQVLTPPAQNVYVVKGDREYMIPAVDDFIVETNPEAGYMRVRLIEGMAL
ncbi:MAG: 16S rRNA processing protein RimM [Clostridiales bacterium]|nr:16S rRNA processing protein RimM [Clostridiales bacterium]